jgi:hypothetical protein
MTSRSKFRQHHQLLVPAYEFINKPSWPATKNTNHFLWQRGAVARRFTARPQFALRERRKRANIPASDTRIVMLKK